MSMETDFEIFAQNCIDDSTLVTTKPLFKNYLKLAICLQWFTFMTQQEEVNTIII